VLALDPRTPMQFESQAWLATNPQLTPVQILTHFVWRWQMETTLDEARAHLGVKTQRQWCEKATARTTPALLALSACYGDLDNGPSDWHGAFAGAHGGMVSQSARDLFRHNRLGEPMIVASVPFSNVAGRTRCGENPVLTP
jgi:hypothetical protein